MPYRDDEHALQAEKERLEHERARIDEHKRVLIDLTQQESRIERDLAEIERRLAKRKKSLPLLGQISVASPCHVDWNSMQGDEQTRFCNQCRKNVYNISAMTTQQAESLIREKEGDLCIRYYQRADGTVLTADCPVGVRKKRIVKVASVAAIGAAVGARLVALEASTMQGTMEAYETRMGKFGAFDGEEDRQIDVRATMGVVAFPNDAPALGAEHENVVEKVENAQKPAASSDPITKRFSPAKPVQRKDTIIK